MEKVNLIKYRWLAVLLVLAIALSLSPMTHTVYALGAQTPALDDYDSTTDIGGLILPSGAFQLDTPNWRTVQLFKGVQFENGCYNLTAKATYADQESANDEGVRIVVAKAFDRDYGQEVTIEINVRQQKDIHIFAIQADGKRETALKLGYGLSSGAHEAENAYAVRYEHGKIWFYENGNAVFEAVTLVEPGGRYMDVVPAVGFVFQATSGVIRDVHLWGRGVEFTGGVPAMPEGNGDYAPYAGIVARQGTDTKLSGGTVSNSKLCSDLVAFKKLPFTGKDSFVWSFQARVDEVGNGAGGVRPVFRADENFKNQYQLIITQSRVIVALNGTELAAASYTRTLGKTDSFSLYVQADKVSVWVNGVLTLENIPLAHTLDGKVGIKFEQAKAAVWDMHFYYTKPTKFVKPAGEPGIPAMTGDMYNAAQYMKVFKGDTEYEYQNYQIINTTSTARYTFTNIPMPEDGAYTYRATVTKTEATSNGAFGPRLLFRSGRQGDYYVVFTDGGIVVLVGNKELARYPMKINVGQAYDTVIQSNATTMNLWIDGKLLAEWLPLTRTGERTKAKTGIWFEVCNGTLKDIKIYGKDVVFTEDTFDVELKNNKWFNMETPPQMPQGNQNYFTNLKLGGETARLLLRTAYVDGVLSVPMSDNTMIVEFFDQNDLRNINGLKNTDTYVWSSKVKVNKYDEIAVQDKGDATAVFSFKHSYHPGNSKSYRIDFCMAYDRLELQIWRNSQMIKKYGNTAFKVEPGREYRLDMLIGKNWAKIWVDEELIFTAYDLPTYALCFNTAVTNMDVTVSDIQVYQVEQDDAAILDIREAQLPNVAGNTLKDLEPEEIPLQTQNMIPYIAGTAGLGVVLIAVLVLTFAWKRPRKQKRKGDVQL